MNSSWLGFFVGVALFFSLPDLAHAQRTSGKKGKDPEVHKEELKKYEKLQALNVRTHTKNELRARYAGIGRSLGYEGTEALNVDERLIDGVVDGRIGDGDLDGLRRRHEPARVREALVDFLLRGLGLGSFEPVGHHVEHEKCTSETAPRGCAQRPISARMKCMLSEWPEFQFDSSIEDAWITEIHTAQALLGKPVIQGPIRIVPFDIAMLQQPAKGCVEILTK